MAENLRAESLTELAFIADPALSPDGKHAFAVHTAIKMEEEAPRFHSQIYLYDLVSGEAKAFTQSRESDTAPRFNPDGKNLAFLSKRDEKIGKAQLFVIPFGGGEARRLTSFKAGVEEFCWSPEGKLIAFTSRGDYEDEAAKAGRGRLIERMFYKNDGIGFKPDEVAQIYLLEPASGEISKISTLAADARDLVWHPDGRSLLFAGARDREAADWQYSIIWRIFPDGKVEALLDEAKHLRAQQPAPSPDGTLIAFFSPIERDNLGSPLGLWTLFEGETTLHTGELEARPTVAGDSRYGGYPNRACWSEDGHHLYFNANSRGRSGIARVALESGELSALQEGDRVVTSFSYASGHFVFTAETPCRPGELFLRDTNGEEKQVSQVNAGFVERYHLAQASREQLAESDGVRLAYWTLIPRKPREDGALVLQIHGGPHTNYGYGFFFEFQLMASQGYIVIYGNPRGSSSYGHDFATCIQGRYGTIDAGDVLAIARTARRRHGHASAPMHLTGGSYGGFMTNWLIAHTDEFRSAATQRSISNWLSFYGTSDIGYRFAEREVGGNPWEDTEVLWRQSPLKYVANITTPLLITHAEEDHRCPIEQGEQLFIALKRLGKKVRFIRFPGEGHELSRTGRPDRQIHRLEAILDWFKEHP